MTKNPPTTLIVAITSARNPRIIVVWFDDATESIAPMVVMPEMALLPDISGVWSNGGTLVMISKPTKTASIKMVRRGMKASIDDGGRDRLDAETHALQKFFGSRMYDLTVIRYQCSHGYLVFKVERKRPIFHQV